MKNLTQGEQSVVRHLGIILGAVSMFASLFVVIFHLLYRRSSVTGGKRKVDEPVLWLSVACFFAPLFNMHLGSFADKLCSLEAIGNQFFYLSSFIWVTCIAHQLYSVFVRNSKQTSSHTMIFYHSFAWGFPAITVFLLLVAGKLDSSSDKTYEWCWISENSWRFALFYIPLFLMIIINIVIDVVIIVVVYKRYRSVLGLRKSLYPAATTRSTFAKQTIFWALRVSLYLFVFIMTRIGSLINRFYELTHQGYSPFGLLILHAVTQSLQGLLFALIYIYHEKALTEVILSLRRKWSRRNDRSDPFVSLDKKGFTSVIDMEEEEEEEAV
eukprot:jgi/Galph1/2738/GphlegSOOS_G1401.1